MDLGLNIDLSDPFGKHQRSQFNSSRKHAVEDRNLAYARDDNAIQRRVADANAAGLHPLSVLGAQISSPVISSGGGGGSSSGSSVSISPSSSIDKAQIRLLNKQADLIDEQIDDSRSARVSRQITPDKVRLPGADIIPSDPAFFAQDAENKYGEISDLDGALMRFMDAVKTTTRLYGEHYNPFNKLSKHKDAINKLFDRDFINIGGAK